jgi:hypothetical protein
VLRNDRFMLGLIIFVLAGATAINIGNHKPTLAVVTGTVLVVVVVVRLIVPGVKSLRAPKKR